MSIIQDKLYNTWLHHELHHIIENMNLKAIKICITFFICHICSLNFLLGFTNLKGCVRVYTIGTYSLSSKDPRFQLSKHKSKNYTIITKSYINLKSILTFSWGNAWLKLKSLTILNVPEAAEQVELSHTLLMERISHSSPTGNISSS